MSSRFHNVTTPFYLAQEPSVVNVALTETFCCVTSNCATLSMSDSVADHAWLASVLKEDSKKGSTRIEA